MVNSNSSESKPGEEEKKNIDVWFVMLGVIALSLPILFLYGLLHDSSRILLAYIVVQTLFILEALIKLNNKFSDGQTNASIILSTTNILLAVASDFALTVLAYKLYKLINRRMELEQLRGADNP